LIGYLGEGGSGSVPIFARLDANQISTRQGNPEDPQS
jgi:hypothetical protein